MKNTKTWQKKLGLVTEPDNELLALLEAASDTVPTLPTKPNAMQLEGGYTANDIKNQVQQALVVDNLRQALEQARKAKGISLRQLAKQTGVSAPRVRQIEQAQDKLELQTLLRQANALGYNVSLVLTPQDKTGTVITTTL